MTFTFPQSNIQKRSPFVLSRPPHLQDGEGKVWRVEQCGIMGVVRGWQQVVGLGDSGGESQIAVDRCYFVYKKEVTQ